MSTAIAIEIEKIRAALPRGIELLEFGGQSVFPYYGMSGGLCSCYLVYLFKRGGGRMPLDDLGSEGVKRIGDWAFNCVRLDPINPTDIPAKISAAAQQLLLLEAVQ